MRFDHGPEFIAAAVAAWCRFNGVGTVFIDPGSPWQNAWIESFNGRVGDEFLNGWQFDSLLEAQVLIEDWRIDYNEHRPHSAHGDLTPIEFARPGTPGTNQHSHSPWSTQRGPSVKLVSFRVGPYKNVLDTGPVAVGPDITVLVGKNESGKTNVLYALNAINPAAWAAANRSPRLPAEDVPVSVELGWRPR